MVKAAPLVGEAVTFWNAPEVTIAGEIGSDVAPAARSAVITNCARTPVDWRDCGFTAYTPGRLITVPALIVPVSAATVIAAPTWLAPETFVPATACVPLTCVATF